MAHAAPMYVRLLQIRHLLAAQTNLPVPSHYMHPLLHLHSPPCHVPEIASYLGQQAIHDAENALHIHGHKLPWLFGYSSLGQYNLCIVVDRLPTYPTLFRQR